MFRDTRNTTRTVRPRRPGTTPTGLEPLEVAFRAWVDGTAKPDTLIVGDWRPVELPLVIALERLLDSTAPLAPASGAPLGLDDDVTIATAAATLLEARIDPEGPHCRSFRAASFYLIDHALLVAEDPSDAPPGPDEAAAPVTVDAATARVTAGRRTNGQRT